MTYRVFVPGRVPARQIAYGETFGSMDGEMRDPSGAVVSDVTHGSGAIGEIKRYGAGFSLARPGFAVFRHGRG